MDARAIFDAVVARFGDAVSGFEAAIPAENKEAKETPRDSLFRVAPSALLDVALFLRDEPTLRFDFLQNLTAVDWPRATPPVLECVYHLYSYRHGHEIVVKVRAARETPRFPSLANVWKSADWMEREQFDLLGAIFDGHPDLRRLMMPDDWVGHPMRKDYQEARMYRGMPTTRHSPMELLGLHDAAHAPKPVVPPK